MELIVDGVTLETTEEGFLIDLNDWNEAVAIELSRINGIEINNAHWEIVFFIRHYYQSFKHLPNVRTFTKAIRGKFGEEKGNSRYLYQLFPQGPLKYTCKIAGLPKPPTCL